MSINSDYENRRDNYQSQSGEGQKLFVKKIPMDMEEDEIRDVFERYGTVTRASILPPKPDFDYKAAIVIFDTPQEAELAVNSLNGTLPHNLHVSFAKSHREPRPDSSNISNLRYGNKPGRTAQELTSPKNNSNQPTNRQNFQNMPLPTKGNPACQFYPCPNDALFKCSACGADYCREFCRNLDWQRHQKEDCMPKPSLVPRHAFLNDRGERPAQNEVQIQQHRVIGESNNLLMNEESPRSRPRAPFSHSSRQQANEHQLLNGDATFSQFQNTSPCRVDNIRPRSKSRTRADYATSESSVDFKGRGECGTHPRGNNSGFRGRGGFHQQDVRNGIMSNNAENATNNFSEGKLDEKPVSSHTVKTDVGSNLRLEEQSSKRIDDSKRIHDNQRNTVRVSSTMIRKTEAVPLTHPVKQEHQIKSIPPCNFTLSPKTEVEVLFVRNPHFITIRPVSKNDDYKRVRSHLQNAGNRKKVEGDCKVGANYALYYENVWYRCQVIRIVDSEPDFIVAHLVDIGKSLKKDRKDLFILDDEILVVPALSMPVKLDKTCERSNGGWDKEIVDVLRQLTEPSPDLQLFVTETGKDASGRPIVNMIDNNGRNIIDYMSQLLSISGKEESTALTTSLPNHHQPFDQAKPFLRRPNCEVTSEVQPATPKSYFLPSPQGKVGDKFLFDQAKYVELPIGETNVLVLHIENPGEFYVIPHDDLLIQEFSELEAKINEFCINNEGIAYNPEEAEVVLAKFEGSWYRAYALREVVSEPSHYDLQFLDYGNYAAISSKDIRRMEDQFMFLPFVVSFLTLEKFEAIDSTAQETMQFKEKLQLNCPVKVKCCQHFSAFKLYECLVGHPVSVKRGDVIFFLC